MKGLRVWVAAALVAASAGMAEAQAGAGAAGGQPPAGGAPWVSLFDGRTLGGWQTAGAAAPFVVRDGVVQSGADGSRLTYVAGTPATTWADCEWSADVMTKPGGAAGILFHTAPDGRAVPERGFEVLIRNSASSGAPGDTARTGSLAGIRHVFTSGARDGEWASVTVTVRKPQVQVRVNGTLVVDYREPAAFPADGPAAPKLGRGTFALRSRGGAGQVAFRNLRVRALSAATGPDAQPAAPLDVAALQILQLTRAGFPVIDLHAHLKGGLTLEQVLDLSRRTGMFLGLAVNCGKGFPIESDPGAIAFLESMRGQPVFIAMQAEGREWMTMFSRETRAAFDYVFTDGMTWTNPAGRRMRLWMPDEVEIGPDEEAFMGLLVSKIVGILDHEPIDIYVNPTFLPEVIRARYDTLWTEARMKQVIDAAVRNGVAIEINARYKIPSERFLRLAKASGAHFTFGTNNAGATDLGDWSYPLEIQRKLGLTPADMFVPGLKPSRAQRER